MSSSQPAAHSIGPYRIESVLSRGGSGVVYRARHVDSGVAAAVKTVHVLDHEEVEGLRREIFSLAHFDHPGVVRVLDDGVADGLPWYAMELLECPTLRQCWESGALTQRRSLQVVLRLCEALSVLHGEGIVHRDLKPENLMVRPGDEPVLVDFGFASRFPSVRARESLEAGGVMLGTLRYMPPEQARGEYVDPRSDLYSLGCMMYEALAGRPPFIGESFQLLDQLLNAPPTPFAELGVEADDELERTILALLDKDPRRRPGYADQVAAVIAAALEEEIPSAAGPVRPHVYRAGFCGRDAEIESVDRILDRARAGSPEILLLGGESGAGKTRLAMEATARAANLGVFIITGECQAVQGASPAGAIVSGAPLHPVAPLLRALADLARDEGEVTTRTLLGKRARTLAAYEASMTTVPGYEELPEPEPLPTQAARARAVADVVASLRALAQRGPVLFVIDDLQWADEMTLALLKVLAAGSLEDAPVLVLGTYRSDERNEDIDEIEAAPKVSTLQLARLSATSIESMLSEMLAIDAAPQELIDTLVTESEGNPHFVGEYILAAVSAEVLTRSDGRWSVRRNADGVAERLGSLGLPLTLQQLIGDRLGRIPSDALQFVQAGAVLGREFEGRLAAEVSKLDAEAVRAEAALLVKRQILEETPRGRLRFSHDKLREVAYSLVAENARSELHRLAAEAIQEAHAADAEFPSYYAEIASHWDRGGEAGRARRFFDLAGAHLLDSGAYRDAYRALGRASELTKPREGPRVAAAQRLRMQAVAAFAMGQLPDSIAHAAEGIRSVGLTLPRTRLGWNADIARSIVRRAAVLRHRAPQAGQQAELFEAAQCAGQLATGYFFAGDTGRTFASVLRGVDYGERSQADEALLEACARLGMVTGTARMRRLSDHYFRRARELAHRIGHPRGRALVLYLEANYLIGMGRWHAVQSLGLEAAERLEEVGDIHEAEVARTIAAHGHFYSGDLQSCDAHVSRVFQTAENRSNSQHIGWGQMLAARSLILRGEVAEARRLCSLAQPMLAALPDTLSNVMVDGTAALAALFDGAFDEAHASCLRITQRLARGERPALGQCLDGIGACADGMLWLREVGAEAASDPDFEGDLRRALRELRRFALVFPIARAAYHRSRARLLWQRGRKRAAGRAWSRSLRFARAASMPLDEARVHLDLALRADDRERMRFHCHEASQRLRSMQASGFADPWLRLARRGGNELRVEGMAAALHLRSPA